MIGVCRDKAALDIARITSEAYFHRKNGLLDCPVHPMYAKVCHVRIYIDKMLIVIWSIVK